MLGAPLQKCTPFSKQSRAKKGTFFTGTQKLMMTYTLFCMLRLLNLFVFLFFFKNIKQHFFKRHYKPKTHYEQGFLEEKTLILVNKYLKDCKKKVRFKWYTKIQNDQTTTNYKQNKFCTHIHSFRTCHCHGPTCVHAFIKFTRYTSKKC